MKNSYFIFFSLLVLFSCKKENTVPDTDIVEIKKVMANYGYKPLSLSDNSVLPPSITLEKFENIRMLNNQPETR